MSIIPSSVLPLIEPGLLLFYAVRAYFFTLVEFLSQGLPLKGVRSEAFGRFWIFLSSNRADPSVPLVGSATLVPPLLSQATGVVLEVGPGSGTLTCHYEPAAEKITAIYGAEPAQELHKLLRKNSDDTKLGPKYHIMDADASHTSIANALAQLSIVESPSDAKEIFDTIVCIRVLCSVPDLDRTIDGLHKLLKPGGKLLICEHTANPWQTPKGSLVARVVQTVYMLMGWSYFIGDCSLTRDIESALRGARGGWASVEIERYFGKTVLPYVSGTLVKSKFH